ncbi:type III polyketide synthase [Vallicoccus soli]|uniref:Type III polyketide synthase n=1 Tax=Vallicoccus soli TaxID=2339232 RepID=A0A3A3YP06_9ACTN|nr:3-oxoacyl-[acyl-carrier-protein] synthase III C-terminal domain-containing protein [Vallicoccus soli]RJK93141.1 type III polyketide synthase [Vallicoccus soli]
MTRIAAAAGVVPEHAYDQATITATIGDVVLGDQTDRRPVMERLHAAAGVRQRSLAVPLEEYARLGGFGGANDRFLDVGTSLGERAVREALDRAGLAGEDVDLLLATSVTGIGAPSLDARLVPRLGLRPDVKRLPVFGLGCVAGAAGIARLHDHLVGHPDDVAVLLSVELCSLTFQADDTSMANLVASGLFGDGAAAVVMVGEERARRMGLDAAPRVLASRSRFYPDTERVMGWDVGGSGFRIVLAASVADVVEAHLGEDVRGFLEDHDLKTVDVATWLAHPGGPKVLQAVQRALELPDGALDVTWECLADTGNLSSSSVLHVLDRTIAEGRGTPGAPAVLLAMGPGFCAELVLLEW